MTPNHHITFSYDVKSINTYKKVFEKGPISENELINSNYYHFPHFWSILALESIYSILKNPQNYQNSKLWKIVLLNPNILIYSDKFDEINFRIIENSLIFYIIVILKQCLKLSDNIVTIQLIIIDLI